MKRLLFLLFTVMLSVGSQLRALPYDQARQEAWFLTDKMAYELNLTSDQYDRAYQVNLDYFLSIGSAADCYGYYWTYRDNDLRYILFDWQYALYSTLDYFFRPVRWLRSAWYFPVFDHYRRGYYYFDRPMAYVNYHGVGWHRRGHNDLSPFAGYSPRPGGGLRDRYHAGGMPPTRHEMGNMGYGGRSGYGGNNGRPGYGGDNRYGYGNGQTGDRPGSNARPGGDRGNGQNVGQGNNRGNNYGNGGSWGNGTTTRPGGGNAGTYTNPGRGNNSAGNGRGATTTRPSRGNFGGGGSTANPSRPTRSQSSTTSNSSRGTSRGAGGRSFGR